MNLASEAPEEPATVPHQAIVILATLRGLNVILAVVIGHLLFGNDGAIMGLAGGVLVFFGRPILDVLERVRADWIYRKRQAVYRRARP